MLKGPTHVPHSLCFPAFGYIHFSSVGSVRIRADQGLLKLNWAALGRVGLCWVGLEGVRSGWVGLGC